MPVSPSCSRPWARWVVWEESRGGGVCLEGTEGAYWAHLPVSERLPRRFWIAVDLPQGFNSFKYGVFSPSLSDQQPKGREPPSLFRLSIHPTAWLAVILLNNSRLKGSGIW